MDREMDVFLHYPGLFWTSAREIKDVPFDGYRGLIYIHYQCFKIHLIKTPTGWKMHESNEPLDAAMPTKLDAIKYQTAYAYLEAYTTHLKKIHPRPQPPVPVVIYRRVLREHREFINFHIGVEKVTLSKDLTEITIVYADEKLRMHEVIIGVNYEERMKLYYIKKVNLPTGVDFEDDSLFTVFEKHFAMVHSLQPFFDAMDCVDKYTWVVHPEVPKCTDVVRRIILEEKLSVEITFNPEFPTEVPLMRILGPKKRTLNFERLLAANFEKWIVGNDLLDELLKFFDMAVFPLRDAYTLSPCVICKQNRNSSEDLPEVYCPNPACEEAFHVDCLYKQLQRTCWECKIHLVGECPVCNQEIDCDPPKRKNYTRKEMKQLEETTDLIHEAAKETATPAV